MKLKHKVFSAIAATAMVCTTFITPALSQDAILRANDPQAEINVRSGAGMNSPVIGYGLVGDRMQILSQVRGSDGFTWYQVRFYNSGQTGWVRGDFVSPVAAQPPSTAPETLALQSCQLRVQREIRGAQVQVVLDSRTNDQYRVSWRTNTGESGTCRTDRQGNILAFENFGSNVGGGPTDPTLETRRRTIQRELEDDLVGLTRDQAIQTLRRQGYNPIDNQRGTINFSADRGIFPVNVTYNQRTGRVEQVRVSLRDDAGGTPGDPSNPQLEARRRQLETDIAELITKLYNDEAVPILRRRGYAAADNGRGSITFPAEQGRLTVTATYNTRDFLVERVQVAIAAAQPTPGETLVSFQTQNYTVRVFRQNDQLFMNVFNKRTQRQELNNVPAIATRTSQGVTYSNETGTLGYYARVNRDNNRFRLDVYSNTGLVAAEDGI